MQAQAQDRGRWLSDRLMGGRRLLFSRIIFLDRCVSSFSLMTFAQGNLSMTRTPSSPDCRRRLTPPRSLGDAASTIWTALVNSVASDHFSESDVPLLAEYCRAAALADEVAAALAKHGAVVGGKANVWLVVQEKAVKTMTALSARLRLCPQSRFDRLRAGTNSRRGDPSAIPSKLNEFLDAPRPKKPLSGLAEFL
jgi:phage terminase small subunit